MTNHQQAQKAHKLSQMHAWKRASELVRRGEAAMLVATGWSHANVLELVECACAPVEHSDKGTLTRGTPRT